MFCFLDKFFISNYIINAYYIECNNYKWWVNESVIFIYF